ncbi:Aminoacyl-histidine dipeptidase [Giardia duodenalis assemblage B]|uniref:Aminoacyl-histidine dipeptidase n=1 Tax=Giardia duodenalis assemblage B TaxID=1394984 RepID=A0A132NS03_GIAIN|nr:Aminoacyl-histidine dipeptidase [Giardia intestinalis assemblage B]
MLDANKAVLDTILKGSREAESAWETFFKICEVPHGSYNQEQIIPFYTTFFDSLKSSIPGLTYSVDGLKNIIVRVPATSGYERVPGICLQGHSDMGCVKAADSSHDFKKDPLRLRIVSKDGKEWADGNWNNTGSGQFHRVAIGIAILLECAKDKTFSHGPLELFITSDEEVGLLGAAGMEESCLKSKYLLNLDSEDFGEICVSCAGGFRVTFTHTVKRVDAGTDPYYKLNLSKLSGGHSGCDIHLYRANTIKLMARLISRIPGARLCSISGGSAHNAIPGSCLAVITCRSDVTPAYISNIWDDIYTAYKPTDPHASLSVEKHTQQTKPLSQTDSDKIINFITAIPHGPIRFSPTVENFVETSFAATIVKLAEGETEFSLLGSGRSSIESELDGVYESLKALASLAGFSISEQQSRYPGWPANMESVFLKQAIESHESLIGFKPHVGAVHAGLEAGLICKKCSGMDAISIGPTIKNPHSPQEALEICTVAPIYRLTRAIVTELAAKHK